MKSLNLKVASKCTNLRFAKVFPFALVLMALAHSAPVCADPDPAFAQPIDCGNDATAQALVAGGGLGFGGTNDRYIQLQVKPNSQSRAGMFVGNLAQFTRNFNFVQLIYLPLPAAVAETEKQSKVQYCFVNQDTFDVITETKNFSELSITTNNANPSFKNAVASRNTFQNTAIRNGRATLNSLQLVLGSGTTTVAMRLGRVQMVGGNGENTLKVVNQLNTEVLPCNRIGDCTTLETRESLSELRGALRRSRAKRGND